MNNYMDSRSASSEKRARIDLLDLKEQREGEAIFSSNHGLCGHACFMRIHYL